MFQRVLIANRGAIATRIIRSLRRLEIHSIAVYAEADFASLHVRQADSALPLGEGAAAATYLDGDKLIRLAVESGAQAIHPGYGFLSENADFVRSCEDAGLIFIGPTAEQIEAFGLKHRARELAEAAGVPLLPGSELLTDAADAAASANQIGYPVMLKSTAGGGGIGMQLCNDEIELRSAFASVQRLGAGNFGNDGVFLEKFIAQARHIEVQIFGDGQGKVVSLGERDCSSQRRNQKVLEECPAPHLADELRRRLHHTAERLAASIEYRNAGTVEFIVDADSGEAYFLEVNTRLQVEHGVTEQVYGVDLVEWMIRQAAGGLDLTHERAALQPGGHAIQVRLYAEDPWRGFQPAPGLLSEVQLPTMEGLRVDHWIEAGIEVPPFFDPMLAKFIAHGNNRGQALTRLGEALEATRIYGCQTNLHWLRALLGDAGIVAGRVTTRHLASFQWRPARIEVLQGGTQTSIQDWPGRQGYWDVGVPPSGPFDNLSFRIGNALLGNPPDAAGLEITLQGPTLQFSVACRLLLAGPPLEAWIDDQPLRAWQPVEIGAGQTLRVGRVLDAGLRAYLLIGGGLDCPPYLGSRATFTLGEFGGHNGRALRAGDVLRLALQPQRGPDLAWLRLPDYGCAQRLRVVPGPHTAPDFFTNADLRQFFASEWEVHYNSSRTGIRLIGPKPDWARADGGEAGLHPSNIHDNAYAFGSVDFTGDMPVILGPDGPSLGGFVCPATVISADLWKLGQLRAGDHIRFEPVTLDQARAFEAQQLARLAALSGADPKVLPTSGEMGCGANGGTDSDGLDHFQHTLVSPILARLSAEEVGDAVVYRAAGDHFLLVEYGPQELRIRLRFRAHALMQWLRENPFDGMHELTPGIRSLQIHYDSQRIDHHQLLRLLQQAERELAQRLCEIRVPSRSVWLPLSWDDDACRLAIEKYMQSVRPDAPWCPSNLEFIRRINGLESIDEVREILFKAEWLVLGLGDVYLGAPVATPLDPRQRLVTTKYNPARTWTAENSVGIGGSYLCVYGMEGPGGYQFVGRTLQMWNRWRRTLEFDQPWLLRFFDRIRFFPVSAEELQQIRRDFPLGRYPLRIEEGEFSLADHEAFLEQNRQEITDFTSRRNQAFRAELTRWHADGQFHFEAPEAAREIQAADWPAHHVALESPVSGSLWRSRVQAGDRVEAGAPLLILESMKTEIDVVAPCSGTLSRLLVKPGDRVQAGQALAVIEP